MTAEQLVNETTGLIIAGKVNEAFDKIIAGTSHYSDNAQVRFLAGALSAQTENFEQAINEYQAALNLEPELEIARFQLGLLLVTLEQNTQGEQVLREVKLDENNYVSCFSAGIIHILHDDANSAKSCILRGIELNKENASLNSDMNNLLSRMENEQETSVPEAATRTTDVNNLQDDKVQSDVDVENEGEEDNSAEDTSTHLLDVYRRH